MQMRVGKDLLVHPCLCTSACRSFCVARDEGPVFRSRHCSGHPILIRLPPVHPHPSIRPIQWRPRCPSSPPPCPNSLNAPPISQHYSLHPWPKTACPSDSRKTDWPSIISEPNQNILHFQIQARNKAMILAGLFLLLLDICAPCCSASHIRHSHANKRFIDQLKEGSYEIVHPFQVRDKSRDRMGIDTREHLLNATPAQHFRQVQIVVRSSVLAHQRLRLSLNLNEHLVTAQSRLSREIGNAKGMRSEEAGNSIENCFYQGTVSGEPGSLVALSTCAGIWGMLAFDNGTALGIWPLEGGDRGRRHPHVLFRVNPMATKCATAMPVVQHQTADGAHRQRRRHTANHGRAESVRQQKLFLELALIADQYMMLHFNMSRPKAQEYLLNSLNLADSLLRRLNAQLAASLVELWTDTGVQHIEGSDDAQQMLSGLLDYATGQLYGDEKDATLMFTGNRFSRSQDSMMAAVPDSICSSRAVGLIQVPNPFGPQQTALSIAHTLGHILGLGHDSAECGCQDGDGQCIMAAYAAGSSPNGHFPLHFSACSSARLHSQLERPPIHLQCVFARPLHSPDQLLLCGNGLLDAGEECDCGRRDQCQDPCCDPLHCQLRAHAQCASHQACCHNCQLRPAGHLCRQARSVCDVAESCDGTSAECPTDGHLLDGTACGLGGQGQCWHGDCVDGDAQCRELWGPAARLADPLCFGQNGRALEYGNCGMDADGRFVGCAPGNERCGLLQCREVWPRHSVQVGIGHPDPFGEGNIPLRAITNSPLGMVREGSVCGQARVCVRAVCLTMAQVSPPVECPTNAGLQCSGHGDCTSTRQCLCFDGWSGQSCDVRLHSRKGPPSPHSSASSPFSVRMTVPASSSNTRFGGRALETATLLAILLLVGLLLLLFLVCLLFCYRRKSSANSFASAAGQLKSADEEEEDGVGPDELGRVKFGQMPSWREEKRKRKANKRIYDALQRITEAANEADSLSLKSRESSTVGNSIVHAQPTQMEGCRPAVSIGTGPIGSPSPASAQCCTSPAFSQHGLPQSGASASTVFFAREGFFAEGHPHQQVQQQQVLFGTLPRARSTPAAEQQQHEEGDGEEDLPPPFGPRLANLCLLMRKLDGTIAGADDMVQPPASADSGNPGSSLDVRESPSLFSDPYRLDLPG